MTSYYAVFLVDRLLTKMEKGNHFTLYSFSDNYRKWSKHVRIKLFFQFNEVIQLSVRIMDHYFEIVDKGTTLKNN